MHLRNNRPPQPPAKTRQYWTSMIRYTANPIIEPTLLAHRESTDPSADPSLWPNHFWIARRRRTARTQADPRTQVPHQHREQHERTRCPCWVPLAGVNGSKNPANENTRDESTAARRRGVVISRVAVAESKTPKKYRMYSTRSGVPPRSRALVADSRTKQQRALMKSVG